MIGLNFIKFNKKLFNRFISGILSALITINLLSILSVCFIVDSAYYPDGWKDWQQSDSRWGMQIMKPGGSTIGSSGCWVSSFCKMYIQAGLIEDGDKDYDLGTFMTWAGEHGCLDGSLCITGAGMTTLLCYPDGDEPKFNKVGDRVFTTGDNKKTMQDIKKLREDGKLIIVRQADHHSILVGDPIENEDGEDDVELYDTAGTGHTILNLPESINFYDVYELADGTPVLPGEEIDSDEEDDDAVEELESAVCDSAENNAPLYRLSKYNEEQKESLAILLNKQITQYELAAMKWNMIVSQFSIPYVNNIYDTLSDDCWDDLFKNVSKTKWGQNPYLREVATEVNENFTNTIDAYIDYLKDNDDKFKEVLKLLNNKDENVYTRIYSSDMKRFATVDDLWADDVLYVKDNTTVIGDALSTSSNDEEEEEEVIDEVEIDNDEIIEGEDMEDTEESIKPSDSEVIEETSVDDEDTTEEAEIKDIERLENKKISNQAINLWDGLSKMYEISIGEQRETFKDILENSAVTTINVPIFVATDATELYNTIFVSNAMELSDNDYHKDIDTSYFESSFGKCSLYLDRWGNICAELTKGNYVLVYPSYANPMFVSTQFEEEDIAGVYYGALNTQLKKYNIKIQGASNKVPVLMTVDSSVEITVEDAVKKIAKHGADKDSFVFDGDSYFITTGLSNDEKPLTEKVYNRNNRIVDISEDSPPMYRYDTTTFAFASKPLLTMMPRETTSMDKTNWYSELKNPDSVGLFKKLSLSNLLKSSHVSDGKITVERYGMHMGLRTANYGSTNTTMVVNEDEKYSILNGGNLMILSKWADTEDRVIESFNGQVESLESSGAVIGYPKHISFTNVVAPAEYPFMLYFNGMKDIYKSSNSSLDIHDSATTFAEDFRRNKISMTFYQQSTYDNHDVDYSTTNTSMLETIWGLEYLDSQRFSLYFTTNSHMSTNKSIVNRTKDDDIEVKEEETDDSETETTTTILTTTSVETTTTTSTGGKIADDSKVINVNRTLKNTWLNGITTAELSSMVEPPDVEPSKERARLLSIPLLFTSVDDTSAWSMWTEGVEKIGSSKNIDSSLLKTNGMLYPKPKSTRNKLLGDLDYSTDGLKYVLTNEAVSSVLMNYPLEDIISIACIWDTYYIPNSPFGTKLNVGDSNYSNTYYDINVVITPYNGIDESNNNTLFWTRETNGSTFMSFGEELNDGDVGLDTTSNYQVYKEIYEVNYNFPLFLLAVNKNADGENLARWVANLNDDGSMSRYVMDLITTFFKRPVTGIKNFFLGFSQFIHELIAKASIGTVFNIETVFGLIWGKDTLFYFIIIYGVFVAIGLIMVSLRYLSGRIKNGLFKRWGRLLVLSIVPITMITFVGNLFGTVTQNALKPVMNKIILTELEGAKRGTDKISINTDDEDNFMLENQAYNQEIFDDLTVKFVADYNEAGKPIYEEVSLVDLYESVGYNSWVGKAEYLADESSFSGFKEDVSTLWYNTNEFIPVHYSKYSTSVFYYFYDWIKSSYLRYYQIYNNENLSDYSTEVFNGLASTVKPNISYEDYIDVPVDEDELVTSEEDGVVYTPDIEEEIKKSYIDMPKTVDVEDFIADKEALRKALEAALVPLDSIDDLETMELQNKSLSETKQTNYKNTIREGEETFMYFVDGIYNMYTDTDYTTVGDSRSDLFGLSYLFNMTGDDGLPLETYSNNVSIEDWALREYTAGLDRLSDFGKHALRLDETVDTITDETVIEVGKDEIDNAITVSPIAAIIQSPYWREYKNSSYLYNGGKKSNMMQEYLFTPDYIQKNEHGDMTVDFSTGWTETKPVLTEEENTRIPWRLYASRGLLVEDVGLDNSAHSTPSLLENRLMQLNDKIYRSIMNLQDVYKDSHISDDTMIFVSALIATFEFNNTFGGDTVSIELDDISTDKLFRVIYASSIKDVIENPNLVYMLYEQGGILSSIGFAITEFLFITMMYLRCVLYLVLMIACIVVCFNEWFFKTEDLRQVLKGILMQLGMLIVGQAVIILMLRLGLGVFRLVDSKVLVFLITFIYAVVCFALLKWHWAMFKSLVKNMSSFGYAAIKGEVLGLRNTVSNTVNSMKRARVNSGYGSGRMHNSESYSDNDIIDEDVLQRRISNGNKLSDDDD